MELSIGDKKKKEASRDTNEILDTMHSDQLNNFSKEDVQHTEKQIDALLNKDLKINNEANLDPFRASQEKTETIDFQNTSVDSQQHILQDDNISNKKKWEDIPPINMKEKNQPENTHTSNSLDQHNEKKGFSIPKIKIRINKDRLSNRGNDEVKKMIPVVTSDEYTTTPNSDNGPQEFSERTLEQHMPLDLIMTDPVNQKSTSSKTKKGWFTSSKDDSRKRNEKTDGKRKTLGFSKNKIHNKKRPVEEQKQDESTTKVSANDESNYQPQEQIIDEDVRKLLSITDELLGKLPEEVIEEFAASDDFVLYQKVMNKIQKK